MGSEQLCADTGSGKTHHHRLVWSCASIVEVPLEHPCNVVLGELERGIFSRVDRPRARKQHQKPQVQRAHHARPAFDKVEPFAELLGHHVRNGAVRDGDAEKVRPLPRGKALFCLGGHQRGRHQLRKLRAGMSPGMTVILGAQIDHARGEPLGFAVDLEHEHGAVRAGYPVLPAPLNGVSPLKWFHSG